jgi:predicted amidohydrolase YtcJ
MWSSSEAFVLLPDRVHVLGDRGPVDALLVRDGRVEVAGTAAACRAAAPAGTPELRVPGATVTPGFTDAHVHLTLWALARTRLDLAGSPDLADGVRRVARYAAGSGDEWVQGLGWDRNRWGGFPTREALDAVLPDRPAYLESHDTHAAWLNTEALRRCGIDASTADPEGGRLVRDPRTGEPTGVLLENAKALAAPHLPPVSPARISDALVDAQREAHSLGVTGVHSVEVTGLADFGRLEREDRLRLRVLQHLPLADAEAACAVGLSSGWRSPGSGDGRSWIRVGGIKMFLDGALGSRTAWMREPYENTTEDLGICTLEPERFREIVRFLSSAGFASTVHAIGDAAVDLALEVLSQHPPPAALPHRIEHLQLCPPDQLGRAAEAGITASMQPVHLRSDIPAADRHWGGRARGAFAVAPLLRAGTRLAFGSDVPVETLDPRQGLFAATGRVGWEGEPHGGWYPENAIGVEDALRAYTEGPALAAGEGGRAGRLLPGYPADLVAWDRDPLGVPPEELLEMRALLTVVGGEVVHRAAVADR